MDPSQRKEVIQEFRENKTKLLVATDVLSRGIDIESVTHIINFDLPVDYKTNEVDVVQFLHRVGRSGRFLKKGTEITLVSSRDEVDSIEVLEKYYSISFKKLKKMKKKN